MRFHWLLSVTLFAAAATATDQPTLDVGVYTNASRFLVENLDSLVLNRTITPHWRTSSGRDSFTYVRDLGEGRTEFVEIDAATGTRSRPFDPAVVANGLSVTTARPVDASRLPFRDFDRVDGSRIRFTTIDATYTCSTHEAFCSVEVAGAIDPMAIPSPDGRWLAFVQDYNLWIRAADGSMRFALTTDGAANHGYAATPDGNPLVTESVIHGRPVAPVVLWSPDSRRLFTQRVDQRQVRETSLVQSVPPDGGAPPRTLSWRYPMATDAALPSAEPWVFDVVERSGHRIDVEPIPALVTTSIEAKEAWWSPDSRRLFLYARARYYKTARLYEVDGATGRARTVIEETGKTFVEAASIGQRPMVYTLANGKIIWFSERDGRGHLYLYDGASGRLERQLTSGAWSVRGVLHLDEARGLIYVAATDRERNSDPYYRRVYRVSITDGTVSLLTPEDADHQVTAAQDSAYFTPPQQIVRSPTDSYGFSPSGRYFIDAYSRGDLPPQTVLRRADGRKITVVEQADITRVVAGGLTLPERFRAIAADGKTPLYGNILRPSNFDPSRRYPVIDSLYPGPQARKAYPRLLDTVFGYVGDQTLAELGFIVVQLDGRHLGVQRPSWTRPTAIWASPVTSTTTLPCCSNSRSAIPAWTWRAWESLGDPPAAMLRCARCSCIRISSKSVSPPPAAMIHEPRPPLSARRSWGPTMAPITWPRPTHRLPAA